MIVYIIGATLTYFIMDYYGMIDELAEQDKYSNTEIVIGTYLCVSFWPILWLSVLYNLIFTE